MTQSYYDVHAKEYAALTVKADMSPAYDRFLAYLPAGAAILDAGCGSGRDSLCPCWTPLRECAIVRKN